MRIARIVHYYGTSYVISLISIDLCSSSLHTSRDHIEFIGLDNNVILVKLSNLGY